MKTHILFFDSNRNCRLLKGSVEDGHITIENKAFNVDLSDPLLLKKWRSTVPLYVLKWNDIKPSTNLNPSKEPEFTNDGKEVLDNVDRVNPEFDTDEKVPEITPELYRKLIGMKILGNMIKTKKPLPLSEFMLVGLGLVAGALILWSLSYFNVIPL